MTADTLEIESELALPLPVGAFAGLGGVFIMLGLLWALGQPWPLTGVLGLVTHFLSGAVFGVLYAASQTRTAPRNLWLVGVYYGLQLWVLGGWMLGWFLPPATRVSLRSGGWLLAWECYSLWLASLAWWYERRRRRAPVNHHPLD